MENKKAITEKVEVQDYEVIDVFRGSPDIKGFELRVDATHPGYRSGEEFSFVLRGYSNELGFAASFEDDPGGHVWAKTNLCAAKALEVSGAEENLDVKQIYKCDEREKKIVALAHHLSESADDVENNDFTISETPQGIQFEGRRAFLVCDDDERLAAYASHLRESLWLVDSWCIADNSPEGIDDYIIDLIKEAEPCEGSNERLHELVKGKWEEFVEAADSYVSYGELLGRYDGEEVDIELDGQTYWIYRTN